MKVGRDFQQLKRDRIAVLKTCDSILIHLHHMQLHAVAKSEWTPRLVSGFSNRPTSQSMLTGAG